MQGRDWETEEIISEINKYLNAKQYNLSIKKEYSGFNYQKDFELIPEYHNVEKE